MKNIKLKAFFRDIFKSKARFLSIVAIVAIGVGFFAGVKAAEPDMRESADAYYDEQNLYDICVTSLIGLTDSELEKMSKDFGCRAYGVRTADCLVKNGNTDSVVRVYSYLDEESANTPYVAEGRLPKFKGECIVDAGSYNFKAKIGDIITLEGDNAAEFEETSFKVVGLVNSPLYVSKTQFGVTTQGDGILASYMYVPFDSFKSDFYTEAYLCFDQLKELDCYSEEYKTELKNCLKSVNKYAQAKYDEVYSADSDFADIELSFLSEETQKKIASLEKTKASLEKTKNSLDQRKTYIGVIRNELVTVSETLEIDEKTNKKYTQKETKELKTEVNTVSKLRGEYLVRYATLQSMIADYQLKQDEYETDLENYNNISDKTSDEALALEAKLKEEKTALTKSEKNIEKFSKTVTKVQSNIKNAEKAFSTYKESVSKLLDEVKAVKKWTADQYYQFSARLEAVKLIYNNDYDKYMTKVTSYKNSVTSYKDVIYDALGGYGKVYFVSDRLSLPAYVEYGNNAERIGNIAKVFPVFFLIVAALVCLTTMTRMVDEQRTRIGVLKAIGYSDDRILIHYMIYALIATLLGCAIGLSAGFAIFPNVIINAYSILYVIPVMHAPFRLSLALISSIAAIICIEVTVYFSCNHELLNKPSTLLRPKAPQPGKRILLERFTFLWKRLSFFRKVTVRNIFRYKKRMLMTVIGIAGCTSLILTGFGLQNAIGDIVELQFGEIDHYNMTVSFTDSKDIEETLNDSLDRSDYLLTYQKTCTVSYNHVGNEVTLVVPEQTNKLEKFISLRSRTDGEKYAIKKDGVVITEKLSELLGIKVGDRLTIEYSDISSVDLPVTAITENYVYHYVYISPECFDKNIDTFDFNTALCIVKGKRIGTVSENLLKNDFIVRVDSMDEMRDNFSDVISVLDTVVLVLLLSAGALAFVVLFNLTNINITERKREIATLKVLGFQNRETAYYVFRENIILTLIGAAFGLIIGHFLAMFVITTAEIDIVMFGRSIYRYSYALSAAITVIFGIIVSLLMIFRIRRINMAESLKIVD